MSKLYVDKGLVYEKGNSKFRLKKDGLNISVKPKVDGWLRADVNLGKGSIGVESTHRVLDGKLKASYQRDEKGNSVKVKFERRF